MKTTIPTVAAIASVSVFLACGPAVSHAQDADATAVDKRMEQLERRLLEVESKLRTLESRGAGNAQAPASAAPREVGIPQQVQSSSARERQATAAPTATAARAERSQSILTYPEGWLSVKEGMTQEEIKSLIGPAHKSFELNGSAVWYYAYSGGAVGSVFFDSTGRASGYQRPSLWRLW